MKTTSNSITHKMQSVVLVSILLASACSSTTEQAPVNPAQGNGPSVSVWLTHPDRTFLFSQTSPLTFIEGETSEPAIVIDTTTRFQSMDGFGFSLTGGSAQLLNEKLSPSARSALLKELFLPDQNGIGISYLRISIGASDLDDHVFSYNDLPAGETDADLTGFSMEDDQTHLIPVLKEIVALNPQIKIMGSPWSAPAWMKTNQDVKGGSLKEEYYAVYAKYFIKYIQAMSGEGITIDAITVQNEPENPHNTPSMVMTATEQNVFIRDHLGPALSNAGLSTKIILFDHNCDNPNYPISILNDPVTKPMVDGTAFHLYIGGIAALSTVRNAHPDKNIYFTEQWTSGQGDFAGDLQWHTKNLVIGAPRNWSRNVLEWNLAADENFNPHTDNGGCTTCQGAVTINSHTGSVSRNVSYYIIAHAAKLVRPGSVRVGSTIVGSLYNVAFITPEGKKVLIVVNDGSELKRFPIAYKNSIAVAKLPPGGVGTYYW